MMNIGKYKYYFKKPKSEIVKDVFFWLCVGGAITIAATSPYFIQNLLRARKRFKKYPKQRVSSTFDMLRRQGFLSVEKKNNQIYISLTEEGKKRAGIFQIGEFEIKKPKKWDGKWRLLIFDIPEKRKIAREALRGKLRELGFCKLQQSVWMHPYNCKAELELLKEFFGLSDKEMRLVVAEDIGENGSWRKIFKLS